MRLKSMPPALSNKFRFASQDNDEVNTVVSKSLGQIVGHFGAHVAASALSILEHLASSEEGLVREAAAEALSIAGSTFSPYELENLFVPIIHRLANAVEFYCSRMTATRLFAGAYPRLASPTVQKDLRLLFAALCLDETPLVRRAAMLNLARLAPSLSSSIVASEVVPFLKSAAQDDIDSMRLLAVEPLSVVGQRLEVDDYKTLIVPILEALSDDVSWRVRVQFSKSIPDM
jgi:serine/threonine-protein phosphatase 2A regulatory subunit A